MYSVQITTNFLYICISILFITTELSCWPSKPAFLLNKALTKSLNLDIKEPHIQTPMSNLRSELMNKQAHHYFIRMLKELKKYSHNNSDETEVQPPVEYKRKKINLKTSTDATNNGKHVDIEIIKKLKNSNTTIFAKPDFSRLDLRVGKILNATNHPNGSALYVETIDVGEDKPRTVVSGLVRYVPLSYLSNRWVIVLCNLKRTKIRGVMSEAMVMCACSPRKVELLEPPSTAIPGDIVSVDGYSRTPDRILRKYNQIMRHLKTNENLQATYNGTLWNVMDKGFVVCKSLKNAKIR